MASFASKAPIIAAEFNAGAVDVDFATLDSVFQVKSGKNDVLSLLGRSTAHKLKNMRAAGSQTVMKNRIMVPTGVRDEMLEYYKEIGISEELFLQIKATIVKLSDFTLKH